MVGARLGEMERSSSRTCRGPLWGLGCSELAAPRRAADGGSLLRRSGALAAMGGGGWAWELRWGEVKPFPRSVGAEGGRRRGLRVEAVGGGAHGGD